MAFDRLILFNNTNFAIFFVVVINISVGDFISFISANFKFSGNVGNFTDNNVFRISNYPLQQNAKINCVSECVTNTPCTAVEICEDENYNVCKLSKGDKTVNQVETEETCRRYQMVDNCEDMGYLDRELAICVVPTTHNDYTTVNDATTINSDVTSTQSQVSCQNCICAANGASVDGIYTLTIGGTVKTTGCLHRNGYQWTMIQKREGGTVDFNRTWLEYKEGFGDPNTEFWLGNEAIHTLTAGGETYLRIEMEDPDGNFRYAEYGTFRVLNEAQNYRVQIYSYSGDAGDSINVCSNAKFCHNGMPFSTWDNENDLSSTENCANTFASGGWWFNACFNANLNGKYGENNVRGILWWNWKQLTSLEKVKMMIRKP